MSAATVRWLGTLLMIIAHAAFAAGEPIIGWIFALAVSLIFYILAESWSKPDA